jgi:hypothetical protein
MIQRYRVITLLTSACRTRPIGEGSIFGQANAGSSTVVMWFADCKLIGTRRLAQCLISYRYTYVPGRSKVALCSF